MSYMSFYHPAAPNLSDGKDTFYVTIMKAEAYFGVFSMVVLLDLIAYNILPFPA